MKKHDKNRLLMFDAVVSYLSGNQSVTATVPAIAEKVTQLASIQDKIRSFDEVQNSIGRVSVAQKAEARSEAEKAGTAVAGKLFNYGLNTGNKEFTERFNLNFSEFSTYRDVDLVSRLSAMNEIARANISELGPYGLDQERIDSFSQTVERYINSVGKKETSYAEKKAAGESISELFDEASDTLRALDKLVEEYRTVNSNFFNGYKNARGIKDLGYRSKALPEANQTAEEK